MKILRYLNANIEKIICVFCLAAMSVLIVVQVFFRYVLNSSLSWSEEVARYLFIWLIYIGISYGVKMDKHICVDAVYVIMPKKVKPIYALMGIALFLVFALAMVYYGSTVVMSVAASGQISTGAHIPMQYVYAAPVTGMILTAFRLAQQLAKGIREVRTGVRAEETEGE